MVALILAEALVLVHLFFILFVVLGGLLVLKWRWLAWIHLPSVLWGTVVEVMGWVCPLTPWENYFRIQAGEQGYSGDFISHYLLPIIYPAGLNFNLQLALAGFVVMINIIIYSFVIHRRGAE